MAMLFSKPKAAPKPDAPTPPPPVPPIDTAKQNVRERDKNRKRRGRASTILAGDNMTGGRATTGAAA